LGSPLPAHFECVIVACSAVIGLACTTMPKKFRNTPTEMKLKRGRMMSAFTAGKSAIEQELNLPYFLAYSSALGVLREGQFQPFEDDIHVGIYSWDLAALQRSCQDQSAARRDARMISAFEKHGFEPVSEVSEEGSQDQSNSACPRNFLAEGWSRERAFPILYKFCHKESLVRFDVQVFTLQFGHLWDFADGGAETSSGWRYTLFAPQPVEFEKIMTYTMPAQALEEHYGKSWHAPRLQSYIENLSMCENRCQVLRVHPWDPQQKEQLLPPVPTWEDFKLEMRQHRIKYAKAVGDADTEVPPKALDLYKMESKPVVLFQAAEMCRTEGNERLQKGNASGALDKYDEGTYVMDKCREVLTTWRLIFRQIHEEKAEKNKKDRGIKVADLVEPGMPREFRTDEAEERRYRLALLLNASQAALQLQQWDTVEARATQALELDSKSLKALYRRGLARLRAGKPAAAKSDFWSMVKVSNFGSKEALEQLKALLPKDEMHSQLRKLKIAMEKETKLGSMLTEMEEDERISVQDERYQRFIADCEQRKAEGQREVGFDDWVRQYEWRYDAEERAKAREAFPGCFSHMGPAPLPIEDWEVDYLTHKEVDKIMYHRQTEMMAAKKRERAGSIASDEQAVEKEGFECKLHVDREDEQILKDAVLKKGYHYWW